MKIAVLSSHTPSLFWFRIEMMHSFMEKGYEVVAIANEDEEKWKDAFEKEGIRYRSVDLKRNGTNPLGDIKTFRSIKKVLQEEMPDKIFTFQAKTIIYGIIAARQLGIKEIYPLIAGVGSIYLKDDLKTRILRGILNTEYRYSLSKVNTIFFQNEDDLNTFKQNGLVDAQEIVFLNGSGVNLEKFKKQELPKQFGLLFIGRLIKDKGIMEYLEACRIIKDKYPDIRCMVVGPYDSNPSAISKQELDYYIESGVIEYFGEQKDVRPYLKQCSVYVLPSYAEGTPKTVLEAMATSRAIITCDTRGCKQTVVEGENGFLVKVKDVDEIVDRVIKLYNDRELLEKMARQSHIMAKEKFDVKLVNKTICEAMKL